MGLISLTNGGTILISRGWIAVSTCSEKSSRSPAVSLSLRDRLGDSNESAAPTKHFEFASNCEYLTVKWFS